jgi:hypothetical protein
MKILPLLLAARAAFAAGPITDTHVYDLAANGALTIKNAAGDVSIQAWDQPRVELTVIKSADNAKLLDRIQVKAEGGASALTIVSSYPKYRRIERPFRWNLNFNLEYRIKAPGTAKLAIDEYAGQLNVIGMSGDIRASDRNGDIFLLMPEGAYCLRAKTKIGQIVSDFTGRQAQNWLLFGHQFTSSAETGSRLDLKAGIGTVTVLKMRKPDLQTP